MTWSAFFGSMRRGITERTTSASKRVNRQQINSGSNRNISAAATKADTPWWQIEWDNGTYDVS